MKHASLAAAIVVGALLTITTAPAQVPPETTGSIEKLTLPPHPHWIWISDLILQRSALIDLDEGRFLGMVNGGYGTIMPLVPRTRSEIYVPATYYARASRGERTDTIDIYDLATLGWVAEVIIPPKRATNALALAHAALSDDDRFLATFNWTTGTSLSIVDLEKRVFTDEVSTPGCSLVFAAGPRRFFSICGDGSVFMVTIEEDGHEGTRTRSKPFFDPKTDPVTEKAVRYGNQWLFVTFDGMVHGVDISGAEPQFAEPWSLLSDAERKDNWRIGGNQHLAIHQKTGRLYSLMHQGPRDTHKEPGEEVWIYDLKSKQRTQRVALRNPGLTLYGFAIEGHDFAWPLNQLFGWAINTFAPPAVGFIQVTQDDKPLLLTASQFFGSIGTYDAMTGEFVRRVQPTGWTSDVLVAPWGGVQ